MFEYIHCINFFAVWCQDIFPKYRGQFLACGAPIFIKQVEQAH